MKKGFTLIELLAVIVILAIIALIASPIIIGLIDDARKESFKSSAYGIIKAGEILYSQDLLNKINNGVTFTYTDGVETSNIPGKELKYNGTKPQSGSVIIDDDGRISLAIYDGNNCAEKGFNDEQVVLTDKSESECQEKGIYPRFSVNFGGSTNGDLFSAVEILSDGYIVCGRSASTDGDLKGLNKGNADATIVRYDSSGSVVWKKTYGGTLWDTFYDIKSVSDGFVVIGESISTDGDLTGLNKGSYDAIIVKYDLDGNIVWKKNYGGSSYEGFTGVAVSSDGFVAAGESASANGDLTGLNKGQSDAFIVKYDLNGNVVWKYNVGGSSYEWFYDIQSVENGYIGVGQSTSTTGDLAGLNKGGYDAITVKFNLSGNLEWIKTHGGTGTEYFWSGAYTSDGFVSFGGSNSTNGDLTGLNKGDYDGIAVKYDLNGNLIWKKNYGGTGYDEFYGAGSTSNEYIGVGISNSTTGDLIGLNKGDYDGIVIKYDLTGNLSFNKNFGGTGGEEIYDVESISDGYIMVGDTNSIDGDLPIIGKGSWDAFLARW